MVEIISRARGPGDQDRRLRRVLDENRGTITRIADHITSGGYSAGKAPKEEPKPDGLIIHVLGGQAAREERPRMRVSPNGRVVAYDEVSGRQIHHIGDIRRREGVDRLVLATKANGYFGPVDDDVAAALADLDGIELDVAGAEEILAAEIGRRLGYA